MGSILKRKYLLLRAELTPIQKGDKNENGRVTPFEGVPVHLKIQQNRRSRFGLSDFRNCFGRGGEKH